MKKVIVKMVISNSNSNKDNNDNDNNYSYYLQWHIYTMIYSIHEYNYNRVPGKWGILQKLCMKKQKTLIVF